MVVYVESPLDRIVDVNFGGGIVVAENPLQFFHLLSLNPADPPTGVIGDEIMIATMTYDEHETIPPDDYRVAPIDTTANLYNGLPNIDGIADTNRLREGESYKITSTFLPENTTMIYNGDGAGTLNNNPTIDPGDVALGTPISIAVDLWMLRVLAKKVHGLPSEAVIDTAEQSFADYEWGDGTYVRSPFSLYINPRNDFDSPSVRNDQTDEAFADLLAQGYPSYALWAAHDSLDGTVSPDQFHNGVTLPVWSVWQFWGPMSEHCSISIINMDVTSLVQVNQLTYSENFFNNTSAFLPGWLETGGLKLTAYSGGTDFSLSVDTPTIGGWGTQYSLNIEAVNPSDIDPLTGKPRPAKPLWTARLSPETHPPDAPHEIARFNAQGLV
jgi:hypothetical protein